MPALRGYENEDCGGSLRFDTYVDESLKAPKWTENQTRNLKYIRIRVSEVAKKHLELKSQGLFDGYEYIRCDYRNASQTIFDVPMIFTNRVSQKVIDTYKLCNVEDIFKSKNVIKTNITNFRKKYVTKELKDKKLGIVADHQHSMFNSARDMILKYMETPFDDRELKRMYEQKYALVNIVTTQENKKLGDLIAIEEFEFEGPEKLYQMAGISLINL